MTDPSICKGWAYLEPVAEDGSARRYDRYAKNNQTAVLMTVYGDTPGHRLNDFIRISDWIRSVGLSAPEIYDADEKHILMEDYGACSLYRAMEQGESQKDLYALAGNVLEYLQNQKCNLDLPFYFDSHVHKAKDLLVDWYAFAVSPDQDLHKMKEAYLGVWDEIQSQLPPPRMGFLHIDYHAQNLMWLPKMNDLKRCGILDFQGAMIGPAAYDWVNMLEDMRCDIDPVIRDNFLKNKDQSFRLWFRVLGTQFHCRLIGQCVRWAVRDSKPQYLQYLPRLFGYMRHALKDPVLRPLKNFFDQQHLSFDRVPELDLESCKSERQAKGRE